MNIEVIKIKRASEQFVGKARVLRLEPYYTSHRIWHYEEMQGGQYEKELLGFVGGMSRGASDDLTDAMSDHPDFPHYVRTADFDPVSMAMEMDNSFYGEDDEEASLLWLQI